MDKLLEEGKIFKLKDLVEYQDNEVVKKELINKNNVKLIIMSYDSKALLAQHLAPDDAIVYALEGNATINYQDKEYKIKEGENFRFKKGAKHSILAETKFKMALLLIG